MGQPNPWTTLKPIWATVNKPVKKEAQNHKDLTLNQQQCVYNNNNNDRLTAFDPGQPG